MKSIDNMQNLDREYIYFDHNATTKILPQVKQAIFEVIDIEGNASSVHKIGRKAKSLVENARSKIKLALKISNDYELIFTSNSTEANSLALNPVNNHIVLASAIEHSAVLQLAGNPLIPVNQDGLIEIDKTLELVKLGLTKAKESNTKLLVSVMLANNETGVIQPVKELFGLIRSLDPNIILHSDITQAVGKIQVALDDLNADMVTLSPHKFGGPLGVGGLILKRNLFSTLNPIILGGGQEYGLRSGTYNIPAIHGFGVACEYIEDNLRNIEKTKTLINYIEKQILSISDKVTIFGGNVNRLPNTTSISMPYVNSETQVIHFDTHGIAVSAGAACSSGKTKNPYVHMAMGYSESEAKTALRVSLGINNNIEEAQYFINVWKKLYNSTRKEDNNLNLRLVSNH